SAARPSGRRGSEERTWRRNIGRVIERRAHSTLMTRPERARSAPMCALTGRTHCRARALSPGHPQSRALDVAELGFARTQSLVVDRAHRGTENHTPPPIAAVP